MCERWSTLSREWPSQQFGKNNCMVSGEMLVQSDGGTDTSRRGLKPQPQPTMVVGCGLIASWLPASIISPAGGACTVVTSWPGTAR